MNEFLLFSIDEYSNFVKLSEEVRTSIDRLTGDLKNFQATTRSVWTTK